MNLSSSQIINAPRGQVWAALNDAEVLRACIPGAESVERTSETEYAVAMTAAVGPVKARFKAKLTLSDVVAPERYTLQFDGQGGPAGFSKGSASVNLREVATDHTDMTYAVNAQIGGKLAQVGQRLIDAAAKKVADEFFSRFRAAVETPASTTAGAAARRIEPANAHGVLWVAAALFIVMLAMGYAAR